MLVTGAQGFIGKNLLIRLGELGIRTLSYTRENLPSELPDLIEKSNFIVHLAGENRPLDQESFNTVNVGLTSLICDLASSIDRKIPVILASSTQAALDNPYGRSKLESEIVAKKFERSTGSPVYIYRLPGVFGKWCKPNYNSVVATFCHNICRDIPIQIHNPESEINLVYIDDVLEEFISVIQGHRNSKDVLSIKPEYRIQLQELSDQIKSFKNSRNSLVLERVGRGLVRKLYSTYVSYLPPEDFSYPIPSYGDERGLFAEVLKTKDSGQFSFFTAKPGVTRGGHYHHSKTEKFLVIQGRAKFNFKHIISGETYEINTSGNKLEIIETVPGWSHSITNSGAEEMVVMLWANEIFRSDKPDTVAYQA